MSWKGQNRKLSSCLRKFATVSKNEERTGRPEQPQNTLHSASLEHEKLAKEPLPPTVTSWSTRLFGGMWREPPERVLSPLRPSTVPLGDSTRITGIPSRRPPLPDLIHERKTQNMPLRARTFTTVRLRQKWPALAEVALGKDDPRGTRQVDSAFSGSARRRSAWSRAMALETSQLKPTERDSSNYASSIALLSRSWPSYVAACS